MATKKVIPAPQAAAATPEPPPFPTQAQQQQPAAPITQTPFQAATVVAPAVPAPKQPRVPDKNIQVLVSMNPKRPNTIAHRTFELYRTCRTTHEFLKAGGFGAALIWDEKHGFIKLV